MSIINLFLSPVNTSFNTYKMLMILHSTAQFLLCTKYTEHDSASVHTILIINSWHCIEVLPLKTANANQAYKKTASQIKQILEKVLSRKKKEQKLIEIQHKLLTDMLMFIQCYHCFSELTIQSIMIL